MTSDDQQPVQGSHGVFPTTQWTQIVGAETRNETLQRERVGAILGRYWRPVYAYLRHRGHDNETAQDLVQGFFEEVVLGRALIQQADPLKGRFRTFLLTALDRYVVSVHRAARARKRMPPGGLAHMEEWQLSELTGLRHVVTPQEAFTYTWASQLLDAVIARVEADCRKAGQDTHWEVFRRTVVSPALDGTRPPQLDQLCRQLGIASQAKASNMSTTVKRRFRATLREAIRQFVDDDDQVDAEIRELIEILSQSGAGT